MFDVSTLTEYALVHKFSVGYYTDIALLFILPTDHCLGRLRPHGSQIFHGSGPDTFR